MRQWARPASMLWCAAVLVGCGAGGMEAGDPAREGAGDELASSLTVLVGGAVVELEYRVTNRTGTVMELEFPSSQRYDFVIRTPGGETVWSWSANRSFLQVLGEERLEPGETLEYSATWDPGGRSGVYEAVGYLTTRERRAERTSRFELGPD